MIIAKTYNDLKPFLMEKTGKKVKTPYYLITESGQVLFVVSPGRNGIEFNKTSGYLNSFPGLQTYQCLNGSGILLMQRNGDGSAEAKEFKMVRLSSHRQVNVPAGWLVNLINTGNNLLIAVRNSTLNEKYNTPDGVLEKKGLAYYVVEKKGEISFQPNPNYRVHPQITTE